MFHFDSPTRPPRNTGIRERAGGDAAIAKGEVGDVRDERKVDRRRGPELPAQEPRETGGEHASE